MDQGLFALTNFIVNVLLARWLSQSDYGAFAVAFSVLLLMGTIHTAVLTEPMLVLGPSRFKARTAAYIRRLVPIHFALSSGMGVVILLGVLSLTLLWPIFAATTLAALAVVSSCHPVSLADAPSVLHRVPPTTWRPRGGLCIRFSSWPGCWCCSAWDL